MSFRFTLPWCDFTSLFNASGCCSPLVISVDVRATLLDKCFKPEDSERLSDFFNSSAVLVDDPLGKNEVDCDDMGSDLTGHSLTGRNCCCCC